MVIGLPVGGIQGSLGSTPTVDKSVGEATHTLKIGHIPEGNEPGFVWVHVDTLYFGLWYS